MKIRYLLMLGFTLFSFFIAEINFASNNKITLNLQQVNLPEAIHLLAKFTDMNVVISPAVNGFATLNVHEAIPTQVLDLLMLAHGLAKWHVGNVWFIAPREELIKRKQEELKWQEILSASAELPTRVWQIKYAKAEDIAKVVADNQTSFLSKRGQLRVDARTNSVCIQDEIERIETLSKIIKRLDIPVAQITIEARLASVDQDFERELGFTFVSVSNQENNSAKLFNTGIGHYSLAVAKLANNSWLDVKLAALEKAGHAELISSPRLFTTNQQSASIESGEDIPYQEISDSGGTAVAFKKAVLGLKVTPQLLPGNKVLLQLQINQDRPSNRLIQGVPTISTRQIVTNVLVRSGQTLVLGGIYERNKENGEQRLPFLGSLPLLGALFKQQNSRENKRELLIFVTPKIVGQT